MIQGQFTTQLGQKVQLLVKQAREARYKSPSTFFEFDLVINSLYLICLIQISISSHISRMSQ